MAGDVYQNLKKAIERYEEVAIGFTACLHGFACDEANDFRDIYNVVQFAHLHHTHEHGDQVAEDFLEAVAFLLISFIVADTVERVGAINTSGHQPSVTLVMADVDGQPIDNPDADADASSLAAGRMIAAALADDVDGARDILRVHRGLSLHQVIRLLSGLALLSTGRPRHTWLRGEGSDDHA